MGLEAKLDNPPRTIGCEFECTMPLLGLGSGLDLQRLVANVLSSNGIRATHRTYSHAPVPAGVDVVVESDSSVQGESRYAGISWAPLECKSRILNGYADYQRVVPKTLEILAYLGARVNRSTGHHLHIGFPEVLNDPTEIRSLFNLLHRFEPVIYSLLAPSRSANQYCLALPDVSRMLHHCRTLDCFENALSRFTRYQGCNFEHLWHTDKPRLEFRYHQGTLDPVKASHWLRLCLRLLDHAATRSCQASTKQVEGTKAGLDKLLTTIGLRVNTKIYSKVCPDLRETGRWLLIKRWKELHPEDRKRATGRVVAARTSNEIEVR